MKPSLQIVGRDEPVSLPVLATATDVREVIRFLKHHPEGITAVQAMDAFRKRIFDARKVSAYEFWKIVVRNGDRLKLTSLGWELAKCLTPEAELYRSVLSNIAPYHSGLQWIQEQELQLVTHLDIGEFWRKNHAQLLQGDSEEQLEAYAASFFHICHAAEVGTLTVGRKGQPTRLHIYPHELDGYLNGAERIQNTAASISSTSNSGADKIPTRKTSSRSARVFISHYQTPNLLKHVTNALELADMQYETIDRAALAGFSIDETLAPLKRCHAAVLLITDNAVDDLLLIQMGAALVHFERRLLLVTKKGLRLPVGLEGTSRCEIEDEFTWDTGLELMRSLKRFKLDKTGP
jgi:hypothetical protein